MSGAGLAARRRALPLLAGLLLAAAPARALDEVVTKQVARIPQFAFESGEVLPELALGFETYGRLNAARDNVVLVCHFFKGDGHAAGRYAASDAQPGWWDELIGSGSAIDTDRWFVVCTDLPISQEVKDPRVVTTGPATIDPRTGRVYGLSFPTTTVRDLVHAQRAVLDGLGVRHLAAATGPSLGGMLALQWGIEYPDFVDLVAPVAAPATFTAQQRQGFRAAANAVKSDPSWVFGDYARWGTEPVFGLAVALRGLTALMRGELILFWWSLPDYLDEARTFEANHYLYMLALHEDYDLGHEQGGLASALRRMRAKLVSIGFDDDTFIDEDALRDLDDARRAAHVAGSLTIVAGTHGHLSAIYDQQAIAPVLRAALR